MSRLQGLALDVVGLHANYEGVDGDDRLVAQTVGQIATQSALAGTGLAHDSEEAVMACGLVHRFADVANIAAEIHVFGAA